MAKKQDKALDKLIISLDERIKELNCLFEIEELLHIKNITIEEILKKSAQIIKESMRHSEICSVEIVYRDFKFSTSKFKKTPWMIKKDFIIQDRNVGWIRVVYLKEILDDDGNAFLEEEIKTIESITTRLSHYIMYQKLKVVFNKWESTKQDISEKQTGEWQIILELLKRSDPDVFLRISRKMLNFLLWKGISEADEVLQKFIPLLRYSDKDVVGEINVPLKKQDVLDPASLADKLLNWLQSTYQNQKF